MGSDAHFRRLQSRRRRLLLDLLLPIPRPHAQASEIRRPVSCLSLSICFCPHPAALSPSHSTVALCPQLASRSMPASQIPSRHDPGHERAFARAMCEFAAGLHPSYSPAPQLWPAPHAKMPEKQDLQDISMLTSIVGGLSDPFCSCYHGPSSWDRGRTLSTWSRDHGYPSRPPISDRSP